MMILAGSIHRFDQHLIGWMPCVGCWLALIMTLGPAFAAPSDVRFVIDAETLIYDTELSEDDDFDGIINEDVAELLEILRANPAISRLQINSSGGSVYVAKQISDMIIDFELDTHVHGDCDSSCVTVFLAGIHRTMSRGSRIGFHQIYWSRDSIASYYSQERADQGWQTPFDFAAWMYLDTQDEIYAHLKYITSRGVDPAFAIETIQNPIGGMWYPSRTKLKAAGVLTE